MLAYFALFWGFIAWGALIFERPLLALALVVFPVTVALIAGWRPWRKAH